MSEPRFRNIEEAAKHLARMADALNADQVQVILGDEEGTDSAMMLLIRRDPKKVALVRAFLDFLFHEVEA